MEAERCSGCEALRMGTIQEGFMEKVALAIQGEESCAIGDEWIEGQDTAGSSHSSTHQHCLLRTFKLLVGKLRAVIASREPSRMG